MARFVDIATVRFQCEWARGAAGARAVVLREVTEALDSLRGSGVDLVVFSEGVEAVGQSMAEAETVSEPGAVLSLYRDFARGERCHVAGSAKLLEGGRVYNAVVYYGPDGAPLGAYRKTYPTISELEMGLVPGPGAVVLDTAVGRLGTAICFDLNYEALREAYRPLRPDILVFSSMYHGGLAQAIWAYECRAFFACAWQYTGGGILDPFGRPLAVNDCYHPVARATVNLDRALVHLDFNRARFADMKRKYRGEVVIDIPPDIGSAMIYSQSGERTAMDLVREFGLELADDYFARSARERDARLPPRPAG